MVTKITMQRPITPETLEKYKKALEDSVARQRIKDGLTVHHNNDTISPDLEILAMIYEGEVSLEFQEKMIEELENS